MTPEAQRIAIAEACGWNGIANYHNGGPLWGKSALGLLNAIPDYLNDLNAMHEALRALLTTRELCNTFNTLIVEEKPARPVEFEIDKWTWGQAADVLCRALLRTLNLWDDSK